MVSRWWCLSLLIVLLALPVLGLKAEGASGIVLGHDAAFKVTAPGGWVFDNESGQRYSIDAVIYPVGGSCYSEDGPVIASYVERKRGRTQDEMMTEGLGRRRESNNLELTHRDLPSLTTSDGRRARVRDFGRFGERVAYVDTPEVFCKIVLEAPDQASWERGISAFEAVVKSFHYHGPDSGEYLARSGGRAILTMTTEIQDLIRYAPPNGWEQGNGKPGVRIYRSTNGQNYGIIAAYDIKPSVGEPQADFTEAWKELAQTAFDAGPVPVPESRVNDWGWQVTVGATEVDRGGAQSTLMLAVLSGYGRRASILATYNDDSFRPEIEEFVSLARPYLALCGQWGSRSSGRYVDGALVDGGMAMGYSFSGSTYEYRGEVSPDSKNRLLLKEKGTYSVSGNKLTLHGQGGTQREFGDDRRLISSKELPPWERTYTFKLVEFEAAMHGPYMILEGVEENELDGVYDGFFPNAFVYVLGYH